MSLIEIAAIIGITADIAGFAILAYAFIRDWKLIQELRQQTVSPVKSRPARY